MSNGAQTMGDANSGGGVITSIPQSTVFVEGKLVAVDGSRGTGHTGCFFGGIHCVGIWATANGSSTVFINGIAVNSDTDADTCGHARISGSTTVFIG